MVQRLLNVGATTLIIFSFTVISGGQRADSPRPVLEDLLSSQVFRNASSFHLSCEMTAYCPGSCCNTEEYVDDGGRRAQADWSNRIAAGDMTINQLHASGIEIAAVDTTKIPYGSILRYENRLYAALDCGSMIKGNKIDLSVYTHEQAGIFGRRPAQVITVWVPSHPGESIRAILGKCR
jgi:3D (Asp-Asp-Asp) domain-containing protein